MAGVLTDPHPDRLDPPWRVMDNQHRNAAFVALINSRSPRGAEDSTWP
jgi:hypothetical protein